MPGPQSFIALCEPPLILSLRLPLVAALDPVLEPVLPPELGLWAAEALPGPQSLLREVPLIEELVPAPAPPVLGLV